MTFETFLTTIPGPDVDIVFERAAMLEYCGKLSPEEAENQAQNEWIVTNIQWDILSHFSRVKHSSNKVTPLKGASYLLLDPNPKILLDLCQ
ncbi:hypothetical protein [Bacteriophage sp.]|nr:hypothetical protein [Bacteriophage sp.]